MFKNQLNRFIMIIFGVIISNIFLSADISAGIKWFEDKNQYFGDKTNIWIDNIINTKDLDDPLQAWAKDLWPNSIDGISDNEDKDREWTKDSLLKIIQRVVNYLLWFLAAISLILIIYHGFVMLFSPKDENVKKARDVIIKILWAIWGIWLSWIIISSIFWIIARFTEG